MPKDYDNAAEEITKSTIEGLKKYTKYDYSEPKLKKELIWSLIDF